MSILLAGGAGFIGSHTAVTLLAEGRDLIIADNFSNSKRDVPDRIAKITNRAPKVCDIDLRDEEATCKMFEASRGIDTVIHFAGLKAVGESVKHPLEYYSTNLQITFSIMKAMRSCGVKKLVFSSSAAVYDATAKPPFTEDTPLCPASPYGHTKAFIEQILRDACDADPCLSVALLRYFNPVGAHHSGLIGEEPKDSNGVPNNLMPVIAKVASGQLSKVSVFGDDYNTPDGTCIRDYIHIMDLAEGHLFASDYISKNCGIFTFNLGTGTGTSVLELIKEYSAAASKPITYEIAPRREGDVPIVYTDPTKAKQTLGFEAKRSLRDMCEDSLRWER